MANNEADASQLPPAIPALGQEGPEGVGGENAEAAALSYELGFLLRQLQRFTASLETRTRRSTAQHVVNEAA